MAARSSAPAEAEPAKVGVGSVVRLALSGDVIVRSGSTTRSASHLARRGDEPGGRKEAWSRPRRRRAAREGAPVVAHAPAADQDGQPVGHEPGLAGLLACETAVDVDPGGAAVVGRDQLMPGAVQRLICVDPNLAPPLPKNATGWPSGSIQSAYIWPATSPVPGLATTFCQLPERLCLTQAPMEAQREGSAAEERTAMRSSGSSKTAAAGDLSGGRARPSRRPGATVASSSLAPVARPGTSHEPPRARLHRRLDRCRRPGRVATR